MFKRSQHFPAGSCLHGVFKTFKTVQAVVNSADFVLYNLLDIFPNALSGYFLPLTYKKDLALPSPVPPSFAIF